MIISINKSRFKVKIVATRDAIQNGMMKKRFKIDIPEKIIGMSFNKAKVYCLSEGYRLYLPEDNTGDLNITYIITVKETDSDGKILKANYGI
jgi:hypothetical protein